VPQFSKKSEERLETCCEPLQILFNRIILHYDCTVLEGNRSKEVQNEYFRTGRSKVRWPDSAHNDLPSTGIDVAPYPIDWNDRERFVAFGSYVRGYADCMGYRIRWGGDWDGDHNLRDQTFMDLVHFEYHGVRV
jgi:peptidoglycan L-alanyl-D-glutamate endopeptidase CwlK